MRIALVHPAGSNWVPGKKDITATANRMAPLGLLSIAAYLKREGHQVFIHDCLGPEAPRGLRENVQAVLKWRPELVGFSTTTSSFLDGHDMAEQIKLTDPSIITVFGGVHVSGLGKVLLNDFLHIELWDYYWPNLDNDKAINNNYFNYGEDSSKSVDLYIVSDLLCQNPINPFIGGWSCGNGSNTSFRQLLTLLTCHFLVARL